MSIRGTSQEKYGITVTEMKNKRRISRKQRKEIAEFDSQVRNSISRIRAVSYSLENKALRQQFESIGSTAGDILDLVHDKPVLLNSVQLNLVKYLETLRQLSVKYQKLADLPQKNKDVAELLKKSEKAITEIQRFLEGVQTRLMSDDLMDLDIQLSVLENELEMDKLQDYFP